MHPNGFKFQSKITKCFRRYFAENIFTCFLKQWFSKKHTLILICKTREVLNVAAIFIALINYQELVWHFQHILASKIDKIFRFFEYITYNFFSDILPFAFHFCIGTWFILTQWWKEWWVTQFQSLLCQFWSIFLNFWRPKLSLTKL